MRRRSSNLSKPSRASGFSLVELMVAIALSLLLLTGVVAIFSSSRVSYESNDQLSRVQETGRFALEVLAKHVRSSGFTGCSRQPNFISTALNNSGDLQWNFMEGPVRGFDSNGSGFTPALSTADAPGALPDSDVLVVRGPRLDVEPMRVTASMATPQDVLTVGNNASIGDGSVVLAYSCEAMSFFHATASGTTGLAHGMSGLVPGNASATTSYPFRLDAEVIPVETVVYFIRPATGSAPPNNTVPVGTTSLWRRVGVGDAEELVQGVERMALEFGLDTTGDRAVDVYQPASATTNWDQVIAVRIALLVRSVQEYGTDRDLGTYQLLTNTTVNQPGDRRMRQVFTTTIGIRNRVRVD